MLKRQQYLMPAHVWKLPVPLAVLVEFVLPITIIVLLMYVKSLTDTVVNPRGWGGDVPQVAMSGEVVCAPRCILSRANRRGNM